MCVFLGICVCVGAGSCVCVYVHACMHVCVLKFSSFTVSAVQLP